MGRRACRTWYFAPRFAEIPGMVVRESLEVPLLDETTATCCHGCFTLSRADLHLCLLSTPFKNTESYFGVPMGRVGKAGGWGVIP